MFTGNIRSNVDIAGLCTDEQILAALAECSMEKTVREMSELDENGELVQRYACTVHIDRLLKSFLFACKCVSAACANVKLHVLSPQTVTSLLLAEAWMHK